MLYPGTDKWRVRPLVGQYPVDDDLERPWAQGCKGGVENHGESCYGDLESEWTNERKEQNPIAKGASSCWRGVRRHVPGRIGCSGRSVEW